MSSNIRFLKIVAVSLTSCLLWAVPATAINDIWMVTTPWIGTLSMNKASSGQLITLSFLAHPTNAWIPVARSYDGRDWELSGGPLAYIGLTISCFNDSCGINVANLTRAGNLYETTYPSPLSSTSEKGKNAMVSRFLEQAT